MSQDPYRILGVPPDASADDIKRAFRQIARECHPDVAGGDAAAEERFKAARQAYELLMDPEARARHDRRGSARPFAGGSFFDAFYAATGRARAGAGPTKEAGPGPRASRRSDEPLDLDDLFNDFGFGAAGRPRPRPAPASAPPRRSSPGTDVHVELEVPASVARRGGSRTLTYRRVQRLDTWTPDASDPGVVEVDELAEVRILPGTEDGTVLRERGRGNAGPHGGAYGDLVVRVLLVDDGEPAPDRAARELVLDISVAEALLGGRAEIETPGGRVRLGIPPGTSSGTRLRLAGKGPPGPDGAPTDLHVVARIVVPRTLDDESRALIERFAALNPRSPRDGST